MHDPADATRNGKLDLVPMIDCIMLLLLFFILTTKFSADEKQISALLPTTQGAATSQNAKPELVPKDVALVVTPLGISRGLSNQYYQETWDGLERLRGSTPHSAALRVGGSDPLVIDGALFSSKDKAAVQKQIDAIHTYVHQQLSAREDAGDRTKQPPVNIHCFSGLPWGYALAVYDAVRAYEQTYHSASAQTVDLLPLGQRIVTFAPPRLRNHSSQELGRELWELTNLP